MIPRNRIDVDRVKAVRARFESKYERKGGVSCWPWTAGTFPEGYGRFTLDGEYYHAHRIAWAIAYEEDPWFYLVLHDCDNPQCVRPEHLYLGSQRDNMLDAKFRSGLGGVSLPGETNPSAKLTSEEAREIRARYEDENITQAELGDEYGVSDSTVCSIVNEVLWQDA